MLTREEFKALNERRIAGDTSVLSQLEPYKVDNAIIMAAGFSSHFAPLSYEKPKGLTPVRGEVLIERQIRQLQEAGIDDITVVVGYKKELFTYLAKKFGVRIVENDEFDTRDNHSSLYRVREKLGNTYVCSSDNYFTENVFEPYVYEAYYAGVYSHGHTKEWCMQVGADDEIKGVTIGGDDSWYMLGHVYFDRAFSTQMRKILENEYDLPSTRNKLWEHIYCDHIDELHMVLRRYDDDVIYEFDSIDDLRRFDDTFIETVDSPTLDKIIEMFECERSDICEIEPYNEAGTHLSCRFRIKGDYYIYRHPGEVIRLS